MLRFEAAAYEQSEFLVYDFSFDMSNIYLKYYKHRFLSDQKFFYTSLQDVDRKA